MSDTDTNLIRVLAKRQADGEELTDRDFPTVFSRPRPPEGDDNPEHSEDVTGLVLQFNDDHATAYSWEGDTSSSHALLTVLPHDKNDPIFALRFGSGISIVEIQIIWGELTVKWNAYVNRTIDPNTGRFVYRINPTKND